jgi:DNA polymerase-3 subunit alpha/error-prone DNA polymerase
MGFFNIKGNDDEFFLWWGYCGELELSCRSPSVAGLAATGRFAYTEEGLQMQFITLEDEWGLIETTLFPRTCRLINHLGLGPYAATGIVEEQYGVFTLTAEEFVEVGASAGSS